jgi:NAD(P)-dependent dehydrogenase (short-subunit alcohol dehydrogenase family)
MLEGKVAIVTGAARGIGHEIALELAQAGAMVTLIDLPSDALHEAADQLAAEGYAALAVAADISRGDQVRDMVEAAARRWGRVDILVNNAGICPLTPVEEISEEEWDRVMAVNLKGAFLCSQAVIPLLRAHRSGKIISISSNAGQMGGLVPGTALFGLEGRHPGPDQGPGAHPGARYPGQRGGARHDGIRDDAQLEPGNRGHRSQADPTAAPGAPVRYGCGRPVPGF